MRSEPSFDKAGNQIAFGSVEERSDQAILELIGGCSREATIQKLTTLAMATGKPARAKFNNEDLVINPPKPEK